MRFFLFDTLLAPSVVQLAGKKIRKKWAGYHTRQYHFDFNYEFLLSLRTANIELKNPVIKKEIFETSVFLNKTRQLRRDWRDGEKALWKRGPRLRWTETVLRKRSDRGKSLRGGGDVVLNAENKCDFLIRYHVCICVCRTHYYWRFTREYVRFYQGCI